MINKLSFLPTESHYPIRLEIDDENISANIEQNNQRKEKVVIDVEDVIGKKIEEAKKKKKKEFDDMLKTALEEHLTIKCHNDGCHIRVRLYFDDEEICMDSCESECY